MKKKLAYFWNGVFLFAICFVWILFFLVSANLKNESGENRKLQELSKFEVSNIKKHTLEYEAYFNDHIPFRSQLLKVNALTSFFVFRDSISDKVMIGKEDWLYYLGLFDSMNTVADYKGILRYSEEEKEKIEENLVQADEFLQSKGIEFIVAVPPNRALIYPEYLPNYIRQFDSNTRMDDLKEYLTSKTDLKIIYPKESLLEAKKQFPVCYKYDTHWNQPGAYVMISEIVQLLNNATYDFSDCTITKTPMQIENEEHRGLARYLNIPQKLYMDNEYEVEMKNFNKIDKSVLILGDSFMGAMQPIMDQMFREVNYIGTDTYMVDDLERYQPDIVIYEKVDRRVEDIFEFDIFRSNVGIKDIE